MNDVELTFRCSANHALLLLCADTALRNQENYDVGISLDHFEWLIDELTERAPEIQAAHSKDFEGAAQAMVEYELRRMEKFQEYLTKLKDKTE